MALSVFRSVLVAPTLLLYQHRALTWALVRREILDRYVGQMLGAVWVFGHPLILVSVYIFIFQYVFKMRVGGTPDMPLDYTTYLLSGLIPWLAFSETLGKAPSVMHANASLVKQVVFPIEVLPVKTALASFVTQAICTLFLMAYTMVTSRALPWTYAFLPILWLAQFLAMSGTCFVLSAVGAYFRDLKELVQVFTMVGMYLMPLAYLPEWVPRALRPIVYLNPYSYMVWCFQDVCFFNRFEHPWAWPIFLLGAMLTFACGYHLFRRMKVYFGSIL